MMQTHELPEHEEPAGPPQLLRLHRENQRDGRWLIADVHLRMGLGVDRAGNPELSLVVSLAPGTGVNTERGADGLTYSRRLAERVDVAVKLDPQSLAHLAWRTLRNSGGKATSGALLRARRGMRKLATTLEPQQP